MAGLSVARRSEARPRRDAKRIRGEIGAVVFAVLVGLGTSASASAEEPRRGEQPFTTGSTSEVVLFINEQLRQSWSANRIEPSPVAEDTEWLRRVYLDIVGHIPPAEEVERFLEENNPAKRSEVIERLLEDSAYVRNWTTIWTNLCLGRGTEEGVSRKGMRKFFREAFAKNRPWDEVVRDLVTAEGHYEKNGAVNYLLAQLPDGNPNAPDYGVQATATTTRLFMGIQVQCTQCHNHPFNDWKQNQFWEFNSFFREVRRVDHEEYDPTTGELVFDYAELVPADYSGPVYFEKRNGLMQVAYPRFFEDRVERTGDTSLREELARRMTEGERPWAARAMVNRMWGHFFGYGFTRPVDDMGPHNPPSHPELLERLTEEFVESGYDIKQLIRWIANSEAYNLTSRFGKGNEIDDPAAGEAPLFSHMSVRQMTPEQLYDSLIVATQAHRAGRTNWEEAQRQREEWLQQFVVAFGTDMDSEATMFNGTIPQALMMMNGELVEAAISGESGGFLHRILSRPGSDAEKIRRLYLSALSRFPNRREMTMAQKLLHAYPGDKLKGYQDLFWALLNSNEFILIH